MSELDIEVYNLQLTKKEMQYVANGLAAFMNVMSREKTQISEQQIMYLLRAMEKFKAAAMGPSAHIRMDY